MNSTAAIPEKKRLSVSLASLHGRKVPLFVRVNAHLQGKVLDLDHGGCLSGSAENISVGGMFFRTGNAPAVGTHLYCSLVRGEGAETAHLRAGGQVVHRTKDGVGVAFERISPEAFNAISDMIADSGCFLLEPITKHHVVSKHRDDRPRKKRHKKWQAARLREV